jgi:multidrug transporter EmrE-like cation transporter
MVILSAFCAVAANVLLRGILLRSGGLSFSPSQLVSQLLGLVLQPAFMAGLICYGTATLVWMLVLSKENLSVSYPLLITLNFLLATLGGVLLFNEPMSWMKAFGFGLILIGIIVVSRS